MDNNRIQALKAFFLHDEFARQNGIEIVEIAKGYARTQVRIGPEHLNAGGSVRAVCSSRWQIWPSPLLRTATERSRLPLLPTSLSSAEQAVASSWPRPVSLSTIAICLSAKSASPMRQETSWQYSLRAATARKAYHLCVRDLFEIRALC